MKAVPIMASSDWVYCVRCGNRVPPDKTGEGDHSKWNEREQKMEPCR